MRKVYLDYNATTPALPEVVQKMLPYFSEKFGNSSSLHSFGQDAAAAVKKAAAQVAAQVAALLGTTSEEIIFTSGGTEANYLAVSGTVRSVPHHKKIQIITSQVEHGSIYEQCQRLEQENAEVIYLPVDREGLIEPETLNNAITPDTSLISLILVNNETGTIQDYKAIAQIASQHKIKLHWDAVQATGKISINVNELGADLLSISGHKLYGPKGSGALYVRHGGEQLKLYAGTQNVPAITGFGVACEMALANLTTYTAHCRKLRDRLEHKIRQIAPLAKINGCAASRICNTLNVSFPGYYSRALAEQLDREGIAVSAGSACDAKKDEVSRVLKAMGLPPLMLFGALRFSVGKDTNEADIDYTVKKLENFFITALDSDGFTEIINPEIL